ncbi:hypothetical protein [Colwellia hornerae]|uniref:hypothetical protein n=1 Tax=Colwellia hornerae TaxID=89402 RepID=UPI0014795C72|nr:hypothetical protein [Colwellia hornerae]
MIINLWLLWRGLNERFFVNFSLPENLIFGPKTSSTEKKKAAAKPLFPMGYGLRYKIK